MVIFINLLLIFVPMAKIISMSLTENLLQEIDHLQSELGFSGRSEVIRAGMRMLIADNREKQKLSGRLNSILLVIHNQSAEDIVTEIKHRFENIINTQIHSHLEHVKCLEIFTLYGDAVQIKEFVKQFQTNRKMDYVKLIVA
jgi:CopG family transcriptional regulator, nickel-responsive regulator